MNIKDVLRDTRVEIDLDILRGNFKKLKEYISGRSQIVAVVKGNGYGHGALEVARIFYEEGARYIAVANFSEAYEVRKKYKELPILVMGYTQDNQLGKAIDLGLTLTAFTQEQCIKIDNLSREKGLETRVHLKINTGFNRLGMKADDETICKILEISRYSNLKVEGLFTHLALTGREDDYNQFKIFQEFYKKLEDKGVKIQFKHICDSLGAIRYPEFHLDLVRAGAILYGYYNGSCPIDIKPALKFKSKISFINDLDEGMGVSYDYMYRVDKKSRIAVIPVGYADGYPRAPWKNGSVLINGSRVGIAGIICMDQLMVDITSFPNIVVGDEVELWGENIDLDEVAKYSNTNKNDLIASISRRVPRVYYSNKRMTGIRDYLLGEWREDE